MAMTAEDKKVLAIRNRMSYREFEQLAKFLEGEPTIEEIMFYADKLINSHNGYGSMTKAAYADESLRQVIADRKEQNRVRRLACGFILEGLDEPVAGTAYLETNISEYLAEVDEEPITDTATRNAVRLKVCEIMVMLRAVSEDVTREELRCGDCHGYKDGCAECITAE